MKKWLLTFLRLLTHPRVVAAALGAAAATGVLRPDLVPVIGDAIPVIVEIISGAAQ